jgi:hypothetical protein
MQTAPILIGALIALIATSVGALVTLFGQWLTRRSEERRHLRQLIVQAAVENWRLASNAAEKAGARRYPLDAFILHLLKLGEVLETVLSLPTAFVRSFGKHTRLTEQYSQKLRSLPTS